MIVIVDYGMGNAGSILNMLRKIGAEAMISSKSEDIEKAERLILPGIGAFDNGMGYLNDTGLKQVLDRRVTKEKIPILGICLGMQLFTRQSQEGSLQGLGWIDGKTVRFNFGNEQNGLKIPHMGWNTAKIEKPNRIFEDLGDEPKFYFAHSYHVVCHNPEDILAKTFHGYEFVSSVCSGNIIGVQFHPEKSHRFGLKLLKNFVAFTKYA